MLTRSAQILILVVVAFISFLIYRGWQSMETAAYTSCLASVQSNLDQALKYGGEYSEIIRKMLPEDESWSFLRGEAIDPIMGKLRPYDCGKSPDPSLDVWGKKIAIAFRRSGETVESRVWSNGPDGIEKTEDDIVMPWGKSIP